MSYSPVKCPRCGSRHIATKNDSDYSLGLGCIGYLLFGWLGTLFGFLGGNNNNSFRCQNCGHTFSQSPASGCGCLIVIIIIIALLW